MVEVVAGLFVKDGKFMICQRPSHKKRGLLWEFVGGKVEEGESKERALVRECREELGVSVSVKEKFFEEIFEYPDLTISLTVFYAEIESGEITLLEHNDLKWIRPSDADKYDFCPADYPVLEEIKRSL